MKNAFLRLLPRSFWALFIPVIILGGIYGGIFTPTDAAVVAVVYSLFISLVLYRTLKIRDLVGVLVEAGTTTAVVMFIVTFAGIFSVAASSMGLVDVLSPWIIRVATGGTSFILLVNVWLLLLGMFFDAISIT